MRPQHITAENLRMQDARLAPRESFNEAAAYHCGKPARRIADAQARAASMRPQHITAENITAMSPRTSRMALQ